MISNRLLSGSSTLLFASLLCALPLAAQARGSTTEPARVGAGGTHDLAAGIDGTIRLVGDDYLTFNLARTAGEGSSGAVDAGFASAMLQRRRAVGWNYQLGWTYSGPAFDPAVGAAMIDQPQGAQAQLFGKVIGIDLIGLVALPLLAASVADEHTVNPRREQIIEPLRLRAFFKRHVDGAAHAAEELEESVRLSRQNAAGDHPSAFLAHQGDGRCLMDIETYIFGAAFHERRSLLRPRGSGGLLHGSLKGRALKMG